MLAANAAISPVHFDPVISLNGSAHNASFTGTGDDLVGDFAQAILEVNAAASQYTASQVAWYYPGARVSIRATGLLPTDTTCQLFSPSSDVILPGTAACVIQAGTGVAYGGFIVGNVLPGSYVIEVRGDQGDFAQTVLTVG